MPVVRQPTVLRERLWNITDGRRKLELRVTELRAGQRIIIGFPRLQSRHIDVGERRVLVNFGDKSTDVRMEDLEGASPPMKESERRRL